MTKSVLGKKLKISAYDGESYVAEFLERQKLRGLVPTTIKQQRIALAHLHEQNGYGIMPDAKDVTRCLLACRGNSHYNKRLTAFRQYFAFLCALGRMQNDPCENIRCKKGGIRFVKRSVCDVKKLLAGFDRTTFAGYRDYVMALTMLDCGARPSELVRIMPGDVDADAREINLRAEITKTRRGRIVPVSAKIIREFRRLQSFKPEEWNDAPLFCSSFGQAMDTNVFRSRMQRVCLKLGIRITPYDLRHVFATEYIRSGGDVFTLQRILGHANVSMTMVYVNIQTDDIHRAHEKFGVLNKILGEGRKPVKRKLK